MIKPGLYENDILAECSIWARYIFPGLWMMADREGRLEDRPKRIKGMLLPYDNADIDALLNELAAHGFILRYQVEGLNYIQVLAFDKHQWPHKNEPASAIPNPPESATTLVHVQESISENSESLPPTLVHVQDDFGTCTKPLGGNINININTKPELNTNTHAGLDPGCSVGQKPPDGVGVGKKISEKPNGKHHGSVAENQNAIAVRVLEFLNEKTRKSFKPVDANLRLVRKLLRDGYTEQDMRQVIAMKRRQWIDDDKRRAWLRPATLFDSTKFAQYVGELLKPEDLA